MVLVLAAVGGCSDDAPSPPPTSPATTSPASTSPATTSSVPSIGVLTPDAPDVRLEPIVSGPAEVLELRIDPVRNPTGAGFVIRVTLETLGGGNSSYELGEVSTFPTDGPGAFALRLPVVAVRDLTAGGRKAAVVLHLDRVALDQPLPASLELVVASVALRPA